MRTKITELQARRRLRRLLKLLPAHLPVARRYARKAPLEAEVSLVGATRMRKLNLSYRGKDRPTDVLSFEAPLPFRHQGMLGELVICTAVLLRQSRELGHSPARELDVLLVHGALHLLGFDHELGAAQARKMRRSEDRILAALVGPRTTQLGLIARNAKTLKRA